MNKNIKNIILGALLVGCVVAAGFVILPPANAARVANAPVYKFTTVSSPIINKLSPSAGPKGTWVTIYGSGFAATGNKIKFGTLGNLQYTANSNDGTNLGFMVPYSNYLSCWYTIPMCMAPRKYTQPGNYQVSVMNANGQSNSVMFAVTAN